MRLLLAGGIGIAGWLPALNVAVNAEGLASRRCRIVWCVKTEGDYFALASKLPRSCPFDVTVYNPRQRRQYFEHCNAKGVNDRRSCATHMKQLVKISIVSEVLSHHHHDEHGCWMLRRERGRVSLRKIVTTETHKLNTPLPLPAFRKPERHLIHNFIAFHR